MARPKKAATAAAPEAIRKSPRKRKANASIEIIEAPAKKGPTKKRTKSTKAPTSDPPSPKVDVLASLRTDTPSKIKVLSTALSQKTPSSAVLEADILTAKSTGKLADYLSRLLTSDLENDFKEYRNVAHRLEEVSNEIISLLRLQLETKQETIDVLAQQLLELQNALAEQQDGSNSAPSLTPQRGRKAELYQSPIRKQKTGAAMIPPDELAEELKTISFTLDMMELLTGVRIINYEDDKEKFYFDVKHTSTASEPNVDPISIEYRLVIRRKFEQTAEVTYIPVFLNDLSKRAKDAEQEAKNHDARKVKPHLPEYLLDNLKFPYDTLLQFYTKVGKALSKSSKA